MAALSIFAGMAGSLEGRSGDLAVLRALGYSPLRLFGMTLAEGMMMVTAGLVLGFALGLGGFSLLAQKLPALDGAVLRFHMHWVWLCLAVLAAGFAAALLPALRAARTNPAQLLSQR
jgi:putative ABC transport system permease protein